MPALSLSILAFLWIALSGCLVGGAVVRRLAPAGLGAGRRALLAWAVGLPVLAYATLGMGLLRQLTPGKLAGMLVVAGALGLALGWRELAQQGEVIRRAGRALARSPQRVWYWLVGLWALTLVPQALAPPGFMDWDGLAEHLAMAKVWLHGAAIVPLWYDHHSEFPATVQMLYVLGLAFGGPVAAKLFSMLFGLLSVAAVGAVARRHFGRESGAWALAIFAATPLVGWLSIVAYVDLPAVFFCVLGLGFFLDWLGESRVASRESRVGSGRAAAWAGVCFGLALAVKAEVLVFWGSLLLVGLVVAYRRRGEGRLTTGQWAAYIGLALAVAAPWYVKSWVLTGNPVYPFAYGIFGGKEWSAKQAREYTYMQKVWGWGKLPPAEEYWKLSPLQRLFAGPRRPDHLLLAPIGLTFLPQKYVDAGFGQMPAFLFASVGFLYLALLPLLLLGGNKPPAWAVIGWALVPVWLWWLISAQYSRYFLPGLAWLAPPAAWAAGQAARRGRWSRLVVPGVVGLGLGLAILINLIGAETALPVVTAAETHAAYLQSVLPRGMYSTMQFLNQETPPQAVIIAYGEPRLFLLDRAYLWGDPFYHRLLDYDRMRTADDLLAAYRKLGITYVLINRQFFPAGAADEKIARLLAEGLAAGKLATPVGPAEPGPYEVLAVRGPHGAAGSAP